MDECSKIDETCGDCVLVCNFTREAHKRGMERGRRNTLKEVLEIANKSVDSGDSMRDLLVRLEALREG